MDNLKQIFAQPEYIDGIGNVYPIQLKDYYNFHKCSHILYLSKNHYAETDVPLLALIFLSAEYIGYTSDELTSNFEKLFSLVLKKDIRLFSNDEIFWFQPKDENSIKIDFYNYDILRSVIMRQNLMFEQKVYKNPKVQEWANKVLESKIKDQPKIGMEEIITTVSVFTGKHYKDLQDYTIYQIYSDYQRIRKFKYYDLSVLFRSQGANIEINDFAEDLDIYKNPYDDLFVSNEKLNKFKGGK